jgi:hypothetical protein
MKRDDERDMLERELLREMLRHYRAANERREREEHADRVADALARRWGYPSPQSRRR